MIETRCYTHSFQFQWRLDSRIPNSSEANSCKYILSLWIPESHKPVLCPPPKYWDDEDNTELASHLHCAEVIHHYQCFDCKEWWAEKTSDSKSLAFCPHCSTPGAVIEASDYYETLED